jgi:hypothetical protein
MLGLAGLAFEAPIQEVLLERLQAPSGVVTKVLTAEVVN